MLSRIVAAVPKPVRGVLLVALGMVLGFGIGTPHRPASPQTPVSEFSANTEPAVVAMPDAPDRALHPIGVTNLCPGSPLRSDPATVWVCLPKVHSGANGNVFTLSFDTPVTITGISVIGGDPYTDVDGHNHWPDSLFVTKLAWRIGDQNILQSVSPSQNWSVLPVPEVSADSLTGTVLDTTTSPGFHPSPRSDLLILGIRITGRSS